MRELHRSEWYSLLEDAPSGLVTLRRSEVPFGSLVEVRAENERVIACFEARHRSFGVVVDMRRAQPRNDLEFENAMRHLRFTIAHAFARTVVLVSSASGAMQVTRMAREEGLAYRVSRDESEAMDLAREDPS